MQASTAAFDITVLFVGFIAICAFCALWDHMRGH